MASRQRRTRKKRQHPYSGNENTVDIISMAGLYICTHALTGSEGTIFIICGGRRGLLILQNMVLRATGNGNDVNNMASILAATLASTFAQCFSGMQQSVNTSISDRIHKGNSDFDLAQ
jgi:hypothetical protein